MPRIDVLVETELSQSSRVKQLSAMFDVPPQDKARLTWQGELPIESFDWNVGLIVGASGTGKSSIMRSLWGEMPRIEWNAKSVIDDFNSALSIEDVSKVCQAVGFNTIPAWMRPYSVLSNGEKFRVDIARRMLELPDPIVVDEFTSVVDRQVAQIGAFAVQKYVRRSNRRFVGVTCHYDVIDWLDPDWIFEPATMTFTNTKEERRRRPELQCTIARVSYETWRLFAPFHYLTADLHKAARCFGLFVNGNLASFIGILHRPHPRVDDIVGVSRAVTLPDWQGIGLSIILANALGAAYKTIGKRLHHYPAHPSFIRSLARSDKWVMTKKAGLYSPPQGRTSSLVRENTNGERSRLGGRPCAVFEYRGEAMQDKTMAERLIFTDVKYAAT